MNLESIKIIIQQIIEFALTQLNKEHVPEN
jgi:hypothetical protein